MAAEELVPATVELELVDLSQIPPYNLDLEGRAEPTPISLLRARVERADGLLVATPEYNRAPSGVLKNAIDWLSRPPFGSVLTDKPVALLGASTGWGGTSLAQAQLRETLRYPKAKVLDRPLVQVSEAHRKFDPESRLVDVETRDALRNLLAAFTALIGREVGPGQPPRGPADQIKTAGAC
jgi:chromate reductase, NAD(P)H dehydrogenase (quinone)